MDPCNSVSLRPQTRMKNGPCGEGRGAPSGLAIRLATGAGLKFHLPLQRKYLKGPKSNFSLAVWTQGYRRYRMGLEIIRIPPLAILPSFRHFGEMLSPQASNFTLSCV